MWRSSRGLAAAGLTVALTGGVGQANAIESASFGVLAHNIQIINTKNANKENGVAVEGQINFSSPDFLRVVYAPQPYIMGSVNTAGETSFGGVGLEWTFALGDKWSIEPGFGYVVHNGEINNAYPNGDPRATEFSEENLLLGSRDLFRTSLGVSRSVSEKWRVQVFYSHLSHGQILGNGRNQGLDQAGVRLGYTFHD